jgi:hypothetical protein
MASEGHTQVSPTGPVAVPHSTPPPLCLFFSDGNLTLPFTLFFNNELKAVPFLTHHGAHVTPTMTLSSLERMEQQPCPQ